ncbi:hypothetical protein [Kribbella sp. NPDC003557]|uniref:hypothetical protein n=1 Tax=Kribbella sp. NPDC003557 TaxID=3154449 RepID=UPI0033BCB530
MSIEDSRPGGLVVIRLWTEADGVIRVRLTMSTDPREKAARTEVVTSRDEVLRLVERWFDEILGPVT